MRVRHARKFFGRPTGSSPKPQQSKLAFQKPYTTKAIKDEHKELAGERNVEDGEEADGVKNDIVDEDVDMERESEVQKSPIDVKRAGSIVDGRNKGDAALANGKGKWLKESTRSELD